MKRIYLLQTVFFLSVFSSQAQNACSAWPDNVGTGTEMTVTYDPSGSFLEGSIRGIWYKWVNYHWEAEDMSLVKHDDGKLSASFVIPDSTALVAWKFYDRDTVDVGGPDFTYAKFVLAPDGKPMPSACIGWAMLRGENTQELCGIPSLAKAGFERKGDDVVRMWINSELRTYPDELKNVFWYATMILGRDASTESLDNMKHILCGLLANPGSLDEEQLMKAHQAASVIFRDTVMCRQIESVIEDMYPAGEFSRERDARNLFSSMAKGDGAEGFAEFLAKYPPEKFMDAFVEDPVFGHYLGNIFRAYVYTPIMERKDYSHLYECLHTSPASNLKTYFWHLVQIPFGREDATAEELYPLAKTLYDELQSRPRSLKDKVWSPDEWRDKFYADNRTAWLDYAKILDGAGESAHAMQLMDTLYTYFGTGSAAFNDFYVKLMKDNGRDAIDFIKDAVSVNQTTPQMLEILHEGYIGTGGSEEGFDAYVNSIKSGAIVEAQRQSLVSSMINEPVELFKLKRLDGGKIDMKKLAGHIIVLDFWATWCGPCKAAMPGMQMAVDRYKDDPEVDFFFISTMETEKDFVHVIKDFIKENGYDFQVLLDNIDENGNRKAVYDHYARQFRFSGIPQKMIIDGKGNVRWIATGYYGSPSALADEISIVIEEIRK